MKTKKKALKEQFYYFTINYYTKIAF